MAVTAILVAADYDIIPISFEGLPLDIRDNDDYLRHTAWAERFEENTIIRRGVSSAGEQVGRPLIYIAISDDTKIMK